MNHSKRGGWPNGKALDYESRDCRFDPCVAQKSDFFCPYLGWQFFLANLFLRPAKTALASVITRTNGKRSSCIAYIDVIHPVEKPWEDENIALILLVTELLHLLLSTKFSETFYSARISAKWLQFTCKWTGEI